jgi:hypothetical protein
MLRVLWCGFSESFKISPFCHNNQSNSKTISWKPDEPSSTCILSTAIMVAARRATSSSDPQGITDPLSTATLSESPYRRIPRERRIWGTLTGRTVVIDKETTCAEQNNAFVVTGSLQTSLADPNPRSKVDERGP